jgi:hypothetical protein
MIGNITVIFMGYFMYEMAKQIDTMIPEKVFLTILIQIIFITGIDILAE